MVTLMKHIIRIATLILTMAFWQSCQQAEETTAVIPPLVNITPPQQTFEFLASEAQHITLENGGSIDIPAHAFVDETGQVIEEKVNLDFREFHKAGDVIASGIPMIYEENGVRQHFQTAGMFEIRGYLAAPKTAQLFGKSKKKRGKAIFVAKTKSITVNMASFTGEDDYNFYVLNDRTGKWRNLAKSEVKPNQAKQKKLAKEAPVADSPPKMPEKHDPKAIVFELNMNTRQFPELANFKGIMWQYAGTNPTEDPSNKTNTWVSQTQWNNIQVKANGNMEGLYRMILTKGNQRFEMDVKPVLSGRNYKKALQKFNVAVKKFETDKQKRKRAEERFANEANFLRSTRISGFGIYNHDRIYGLDGAVTLQANFELEDKSALDKTTSIFLVTGDNRSVIRYTASSWRNFRYMSTDQNKLIAILEGNKMGVFTSESFQSLNVKSGDKCLFRLKVVDNIQSLEDLKNLIAKL